MKKLLFLTAAIGFAFSLNAQQIPVREHVPVSIQTQSTGITDVPLTKPTTFLNANMQKSVQKSTNAPNYTFFGERTSGSFTATTIGSEPTVSARALTLFPDSLPKQYQVHPDAPDSNFSFGCFPATGFVFDPYSTSFGSFGEGTLFSSGEDTMYGYKVENLAIPLTYQIANYNASSPDTLRLYFNSYPVYPLSNNPDNNNENYVRLYYEDGRKTFGPCVQFTNPISQKGTAVTPKAEPLIVNYILSTTDSVIPPHGYIVYKWINIEINEGAGFEVDPGHVMSVVAKFIPGYDYQLDDTISYTAFSKTTGDFLYDSIKMNRFRMRGWNFGGTADNPVTEPYDFADRHGFNAFTMEDMDLRYKDDSVRTYTGRYTYNPGYNIGIAFEFDLFVSDVFGINPDNVSITEPTQLISAIYPNPATSQLTIDLKEEGNASIVIYNILGQALIQENVSDMSNTINISDLSQGMYVVKVTQNGKVNTVKFSKQ